jgi:hypothetical protein
VDRLDRHAEAMNAVDWPQHWLVALPPHCGAMAAAFSRTNDSRLLWPHVCQAFDGNAIRRSRVDRLWPLRRVRFFSCGAVACAYTHPSTSAIAFSDAKSSPRAESYTFTDPDANTASSIHADGRCARRRNPNPNRWRGSRGFSGRQRRSRDQDRLRRNVSSGRVGRGRDDHAGVCRRVCVADSCRSGVEGRNGQL